MTYCVTLYGFHFLNEFPLSLFIRSMSQGNLQTKPRARWQTILSSMSSSRPNKSSRKLECQPVSMSRRLPMASRKVSRPHHHVKTQVLCTNVYCFAYFWKRILTFTIYFRCQILTCSELKPPENGRFVHYPCSNVFNSACGIQCLPGFELQSGSSVRMCLPNGQWSGTQPRYTMYIIVL